MQTTEELDSRSHKLHRQVGASRIISVALGMLLWINGGVAVAESSFEARDVMTRGTVEVGVATGFWQGTTAVGNSRSANRSAVFVLPRVGMVLTDPLGTGR